MTHREAWERAQAAWDDGRDPFADDDGLDELLRHPEQAGRIAEVTDLLDELSRARPASPATAGWRHAARLAAACLAVVLLAGGMVRLAGPVGGVGQAPPDEAPRLVPPGVVLEARVRTTRISHLPGDVVRTSTIASDGTRRISRTTWESLP